MAVELFVCWFLLEPCAYIHKSCIVLVPNNNHFAHSRCRAIDIELSWFSLVRFRACRSLQQQNLWLEMIHLQKYTTLCHYPGLTIFHLPTCFSQYSCIVFILFSNPGVLMQGRCGMEGLSTCYRSKRAQEDPLWANQSAFKPEYPPISRLIVPFPPG